MLKKINSQPVKLIIGIGRRVWGIMLIIAAFSITAFADGNEQLEATLPVYTGKYDFGVVTLGSFSLRGEATTLMKIPENAEIIAAYVYMSGYSNLTPSQLGDITVMLSNGENTVTVQAKCIGYSQEGQNQSFTYRADATEVVTTGENRYHVLGYTLPARPTSGFLYGGGLIAIYSLPNIPESSIWIADGLDYFDANSGYPATKTVVFPFDWYRYERHASVKIFSGFNKKNSASAVWHKVGNGDLPIGDIIDTPGAVDYQNSSSNDPNIDTDPLTNTPGNKMNWAMVEYSFPVQSEQGWIAFQLESQTDNPNKSPYIGIWNMVALKLPLEETGMGSIGDEVFYDRNSNGIIDPGEAGIPTVLVSLYKDNGNNIFEATADTLIDSVRTNRLGYYLFQYLNNGTYFVDLDHPYMNDSSVILTTNNIPAGPIHVVAGNPILDIDFGFTSSSQLPYNPVQFNSFDFQSNFDGIWLNWSTLAGTENLGFDIYRSLTDMGNYSLINENVIPVSNSSQGIHNYTFFDQNVEPGQTYYYQIADVSLSGQTTMYGPISATAAATDVSDNKTIENAPDDYSLGEAYPNPFNGRTSIQFSMVKFGMIKIEVYNLMGQKIRTLISEQRPAGTHFVCWDGKNDFGQRVGSGLYLYKMTINNFQASKRILYLK